MIRQSLGAYFLLGFLLYQGSFLCAFSAEEYDRFLSIKKSEKDRVKASVSQGKRMRKLIKTLSFVRSYEQLSLFASDFFDQNNKDIILTRLECHSRENSWISQSYDGHTILYIFYDVCGIALSCEYNPFTEEEKERIRRTLRQAHRYQQELEGTWRLGGVKLPVDRVSESRSLTPSQRNWWALLTDWWHK